MLETMKLFGGPKKKKKKKKNYFFENLARLSLRKLS